MADELIAGATVGDVRYVVAYLDVNTNNLYDANGNLYGNNTLMSTLGNEFTLELHYVKDIPTSENPNNWTVWDGLEGQTVSSTLAFDNDFLHALEGKVSADTAVESTYIQVSIPDVDKDTLSPAGILVINPFEIAFTNPNTGMTINQKVMVNYSSFEFVEGTADTYKFMITDIDGLEVDVPAGVLVRVSDPMYMLVDSDSIYEANIQPRYSEGVFKFPMKILSRKLLKALDYSNSSGVSGTLEHNIYIERNNLSGVVASGSTNICYRDKSLDKVAQDIDYYAWQNTSGGITTTLYTKSEIPVLNEKVYKKLSNGTLVDANMVVSSDSSTASSTQIKKADGTGSASTYTKTSSLNEYAPYVFCGWNDKANTNPTIYYTKGNDVQTGDAVYTIDSTTNIATVVSGTTVDPTYDTDYVLYRTFSFPFIVKNLVDYGVSLNIPVDDTDWVKDYIISIVHNNMEEIVTVASNSVFGVVKIGGNIGVENGVISVKDASTDDKGLIEIATSAEVTAGESAVLAVTPATLKTELDKKQANLSTNNPLSIDASTVSLNYDGVLVLTDANKLTVRNASTDETGVVYTASSVRTVADVDPVSITENYVPTVGAVESALFTKQNNLSNGNVTTLNMAVGAKIDVNVGDGLDVGATGTTNANKLIVNEASVKEVLEDVADGGIEPAVNEIVTADNLHGALSVGQAVDVSSAPYKTGGTITYDEDGFLGGFTCSLVSGDTVGFYDTTDHKFPKYAEDASGNPLHYLFIADVSGTGTITPNGEDSVVLSSTPKRISMEVTAKDTGYFSADTNANVVVSNWRQYEVNALTEKAKDYLASSVTNPNPDTLFRSSSTYSIMNKYLVKQDMVCPFVPTINMPDNSDLTVAAGLSYKIKYTNDKYNSC